MTQRKETMKCDTSKEGYAMVLTCFLDEFGMKDTNSLKVRIMLESTCIPYKANGELAKEWELGRPMYLHACRGILDSDENMIMRYGKWVEKGRKTLENESDVKQMFDALNAHFETYTLERHREIVKKTRIRLLEIG